MAEVSIGPDQPRTTFILGRPKTWTGKIVSLDDWRALSAWDKHGPDGRHWTGLGSCANGRYRNDHSYDRSQTLKMQKAPAVCRGHFRHSHSAGVVSRTAALRNRARRNSRQVHTLCRFRLDVGLFHVGFPYVADGILRSLAVRNQGCWVSSSAAILAVCATGTATRCQRQSRSEPGQSHFKILG